MINFCTENCEPLGSLIKNGHKRQGNGIMHEKACSRAFYERMEIPRLFRTLVKSVVNEVEQQKAQGIS